MKLINRTFTYPVLTNTSDDYIKSKMICSMETQINEEMLTIQAQAQIENDQINEMIRDGDAELLLHLECSSMFYRTFERMKDGSVTLSIPLSRIGQEVEINILAVAARNLYNYSNEDLNDDYNGLTFDLDKGSFLAIQPMETLILTKQMQAGGVKNVPVVMIRSDRDEYLSFYITEQEKIGIRVPAELFDRFSRLSMDPHRKFLLQEQILYPVLTAICSKCRYDESFYKENRNRFWMNQFQDFLEQNGENFDDLIDDEMNGPFKTAQILLEQPIASQLCYFEEFSVNQEDE